MVLLMGSCQRHSSSVSTAKSSCLPIPLPSVFVVCVALFSFLLRAFLCCVLDDFFFTTDSSRVAGDIDCAQNNGELAQTTAVVDECYCSERDKERKRERESSAGSPSSL